MVHPALKSPKSILRGIRLSLVMRSFVRSDLWKPFFSAILQNVQKGEWNTGKWKFSALKNAQFWNVPIR